MKLHIGGKEKKIGWHILNIQHAENVDFIGDISDLSQFKDETITDIYASHIFEHVLQENIESTLHGLYRILCQNGKFYISVPDMDILCKTFIDPKAPPQVKFHVIKMIFGGQIDQFDFHYFGWNFMLLNQFLKKTGFKKTQRVKSFSLFNDTSDYAPYGAPISLNVIAYK